VCAEYSDERDRQFQRNVTGCGLPHGARQRQTARLGDRVQQMEQIRGMMRLMIPLDLPAQCGGLIRGAPRQGDRQALTGRGQRLCPSRGGAILGILLEQIAWWKVSSSQTVIARGRRLAARAWRCAAATSTTANSSAAFNACSRP
jgi:hypothetical protein